MSDTPTKDASETSPYIRILQGEDTHEEDLQRRIQDRGRWALCLFVLCLGLGYANIYQLMQAKGIPYIHTVDSHGQTVTTVLRRPDEIPADDPNRQAAARTLIMNWVQNAWQRSLDKDMMAADINSALRITKGDMRGELQRVILAEEVFKRIEKETVVVYMPHVPVLIAGETWLAEWDEIVRDRNKIEIRRTHKRGRFQIAQQDDWITELNAYGLGIVDWPRELFGK